MISKNGLYIGIDPGSSSGGIAVIRTFIGYPDEVKTIQIGKMTERDIWNFFESAVKDTTIGAEKFCIIEKVQSMPGQGRSSIFKFGLNYGDLRMALIGNKIPYDEHSPMKWQKYYSMKRRVIGEDKDGNKTKESDTDWKRRLRQKAEQLFPDVKMVNNIADALLIANYCKYLKYGEQKQF